METLYQWFYSFVNTMNLVWTWLTTEVEILGFNVAPIYLMVGSFLILGIVRAIVGVL